MQPQIFETCYNHIPNKQIIQYQQLILRSSGKITSENEIKNMIAVDV